MGNFVYDRNNYQNTGFTYAPSPPDDYFLPCPVHEVSSEDCGCYVDVDGGYEACEVPEGYLFTCRCGEQIHQIVDSWWHRSEDEEDSRECATGGYALPRQSPDRKRPLTEVEQFVLLSLTNASLTPEDLAPLLTSYKGQTRPNGSYSDVIRATRVLEREGFLTSRSVYTKNYYTTSLYTLTDPDEDLEPLVG